MIPKKRSGQGLGGGIAYDTLGYTFAGSIMLFAGVGYLLDRWLGWVPVLTILGTLAGAGLAFIWVYRQVRVDETAAREVGRHDAGDR